MATTESTERTLSIAEAAHASGLSSHTLRYYERTGLLEPVIRDGSGHRRYREADLERISFLTKLRATGMPIREVRRYAGLMKAGEATNEERLALLEAHREAVRRRTRGDRPQPRAGRVEDQLLQGKAGTSMKRRTLRDLEVSALGLGCMGMSAFYGPTDEDEGVRTIQRALELGIDFVDTAQLYGPLTNEILVGRAIKGHRDQYVIATKFSRRLDDAVPGDMSSVGPQDSSAEHVRRSVEGSLERLGTDYIDLYYQHRVDPNVPIEETVGAMADLVEQGKVRHIGLSEAAPETIRRANAVHPITAVQTEYSLWSRDPEAEVLPTCRELGIGFVPYSPLGRGFLAGRFTSPDELDVDDFRRRGPRFTGENLEANLELAAKVKEIAAEKGVTPAQLAIAWVLARGDDLVPIPGTKRRTYLEQNAGSIDVELTPDDLARIDAELPQPAGERYDEAGMAGVSL